MIQEQFVSFETAKLLKEKGFDEEVSRWYVTNFPKEGTVLLGVGDKTTYTQAPTQQMACRWLREMHDIKIDIWWNNRIVDGNYDTWASEVIDEYDDPCFIGNYKLYEEACEAAIKYCLENLIK